MDDMPLLPPTLRVACAQSHTPRWPTLWGPAIECAWDTSNTLLPNVGTRRRLVPAAEARAAALGDQFKCNILAKHLFEYNVEYQCRSGFGGGDEDDDPMTEVSTQSTTTTSLATRCLHDTTVWLGNVLSPVAEFQLQLPNVRDFVDLSYIRCASMRQVLNCPGLSLNGSFFETAADSRVLQPIRCFLSYAVSTSQTMVDVETSSMQTVTITTESSVIDVDESVSSESLQPATAASAVRDITSIMGAASYDWWFLCVLLFVVAGAVGNVLVCLAVVRDRRLQNVTNYFLFSLAIADLLVSLVVMPLGAIPSVIGYWPLSLTWCSAYVTCDVLACSSSILHMCFISVGRYTGINNPLGTRHSSTKRRTFVKITIVWLMAMMVCSSITVLALLDKQNIMPHEHMCAINNRGFFVFGSLVTFYIPMVVMVSAFAATVRLLGQKAKFTAMDGADSGIWRSSQYHPNRTHTSGLPSPSSARAYTHPPTTTSNGTSAASAAAAAVYWDQFSDDAAAAPLRHARIHRPKSNRLQQQQQQQQHQEQCPTTTGCTADDAHACEYGETACHSGNDDDVATGVVTTTTTTTSTRQSISQQSTGPHQRHQRAFGIGINSNSPMFTNTATQTSLRRNETTASHNNNNHSHIGADEDEDDEDADDDDEDDEESRREGDSGRRFKLNSLNFQFRNVARPAVKLNIRFLSTRRHKRNGMSAKAVETERKATKVLGIVFFTFVLCWSPFFILNIVFAACPWCAIPDHVVSLCLWLGYVSSTINPIIYTIFNRKFRAAFIRLLRCDCKTYSSATRYRSVMGERGSGGDRIGRTSSSTTTTPSHTAVAAVVSADSGSPAAVQSARTSSANALQLNSAACGGGGSEHQLPKPPDHIAARDQQQQHRQRLEPEEQRIPDAMIVSHAPPPARSSCSITSDCDKTNTTGFTSSDGRISSRPMVAAVPDVQYRRRCPGASGTLTPLLAENAAAYGDWTKQQPAHQAHSDASSLSNVRFSRTGQRLSEFGGSYAITDEEC